MGERERYLVTLDLGRVQGGLSETWKPLLKAD